MPTYFRITIRFLQSMSHGRGDRDPEWPPSPLRVFQSLVAASAALWNERARLAYAAPALRWLERQPLPLIVAAAGEPSRVKYRLYVPDNSGDLAANAWSRGETTKIVRRSEKDVRPIYIQGDAAVHYLWSLPDDAADFEKHKDVLLVAARSITHVGWGVDMVVADASITTEDEANQLEGERWMPIDETSATGLRVPIEGTLNDLINKHGAFLDRVGAEDDFRPVPPLSAFRVVDYRRATDPPRRPVAAFSLLRPDASGFRSFDPARQSMIVAGMVRHAAGDPNLTLALGWTDEKVGSFILGHGESRGQSHAPVIGARLAYIPIPSIEPRGEGRAEVVGSVRRVLLTTFGDHATDDIHQIARLLTGSELIDKDKNACVAILALIRKPGSDNVVRRYLEPSATWATVTPIILPGYDDPRQHRRKLFPKSEDDPSTNAEDRSRLLDKLDRRVDQLIRKAIRQAGYSEELARFADLEWRSTGFWSGTDLANRYQCPKHLQQFRRLHVFIRWRDASGQPVSIAGPICLGGGRHYGLGLFAATPDGP